MNNSRYQHQNKSQRLIIFIFVLLITNIFSLTFPKKTYSQTILKGSISTIIEKGNTLEINLNTPVNFYFSLPGDKIAAYIPKDIKINDSLYIPKGSRFEGIITKIQRPKRFGIDGSFEIDFNKIVTPENISIPIYASVSTDTSPKSKKIAKTLTYDTALITYGALQGAVAGIQWGGIPLAITSDGISVLAGTGIGASLGIIGSVKRTGKIPSISNIVPTTLELKSDLFVFGNLPQLQTKSSEPRAQSPDFKGFRFSKPIKQDEVEIYVQNIKKEKSKEHGNYIVLDISLTNKSNKKLNLSDLVLLSNEELDPLHPNILLTGFDTLASVEPFKTINAKIAFTVKNHKVNYDLALIDPLDNIEIVRIPLNKEAGSMRQEARK